MIFVALFGFTVVIAPIHGAYKVTSCVHRRMFMQRDKQRGIEKEKERERSVRVQPWGGLQNAWPYRDVNSISANLTGKSFSITTCYPF